MATDQKHRKKNNFNITLDTGNETIEPIECEKLLGGHITNDFKWNQHIRDNKKSLFKTLTSRVNALSKVCHVSSFKTRKIIANGIVMSPILNLIQVWGGCSNYLINCIQILQNRACLLYTSPSPRD